MKKLLTIAAIALFLTACAGTKPHHACGITELNKQYSCGKNKR
tara:strand:+ start:223 stop:351 length:129 start_codon:yes stop_codon:yes gene_type:complete